MAVQFILGRSGTGKTSYCIQAIVGALLEPKDDQSLLFLVPEQATYQAERAILADKRISGYHRLHVLSFDRLQFWLLGKNTARPDLTRIGQQMIIHRILREQAHRLKVFGRSANWPGLGRQMARTIIELHQYAKTPDDIEQLLASLQKDKAGSLTALKFANIALILDEYLKSIEGRFVDPDIQLTRTCQAVPGARFVRGARLWVDGFASFTAGELALLAELLKAVADAQIALCLDPSTIDLANPDVDTFDHIGLFSPTERTYAAVIEIIAKSKLPLAKPLILEQTLRFAGSPQLAHVERHLFADAHGARKRRDSTTTPEVPKAAADSIRIISAPNARAEVRFVARQILHLVRERDYRYRDIAVIASDMDSYQHYVEAYFQDYGIPFFIDRRRPLNQHPVVQLICSALQAVTGGFSHSDIFAYLKTDLVPIERCQVDRLENYCVAFGISGRDWTSEPPWLFAGPDAAEFDEEQINQVRLQAVKPLLDLRDKLCSSDGEPKTVSPEQFTRAIFELLGALNVQQELARWIEEAAEQRDYAAVDEHRQLYDKLLNVFDELGEVFSGQHMSAPDYLAIVNSAFEQLTLAFIPPTLDQVLVGSIERSRHPDLKAVFLVGVTQRQFPVPVTFETILTEDDRSVIEKADFVLSPAVRQTLADRQYLAYIAFTRPSEHLHILYPSLDDKGGAVPRSQFVAELESLFDDLAEEPAPDEYSDIEKIYSETELADLLCSRLGRDALAAQRDDSSELAGLLDDVCGDAQLMDLGRRLVWAVSYENRAELDQGVVERLFARRMSSSATRLSTFAACPYRYFCRYILELAERKEFKIRPLDVGDFYHRVLDGLLKRLRAAGEDFAAVGDEHLLELLREQISNLVAEDSFISNFARRSGHNAFIIHSAGEYLEDCVLAIAEMVRAGSFRPSLSEVAFGEADSILGRYELALPDGRLLSLNGRIDRLDVAQSGGDEIALIFDYKRRSQSFSWAKFYYGLDMQLPIYMLAVRHATGSKIRNSVGAFYMPIEVAPERTTLDELSEPSERFRHKARGIFNGQFFQQLDSSDSNRFYNFFVTRKGDQYGYGNISGALRPAAFDKLLEFTEAKIIEFAEEIISGKIDITPYRLSGSSPCSYCEYRSACRFDWQINDYNVLESLNKVQALEKMETAHARQRDHMD